MKESICYKLAQIAVLRDDGIGNYDKLEVLRTLMDAENLALYKERNEQEDESQ